MLRLSLGLRLDERGAAGAGGKQTNTCVINCGTDGTYWFYDSNTVGMGTATPFELADGTFWYSFKADATGKYIIQFGDTGVTQVTNVTNILITYGEGGVKVAQWDDVEKYYSFTDLELFALMKAEFDAVEPAGTYGFCLDATILPSPFIRITYDEMLRGGYEDFVPTPTPDTTPPVITILGDNPATVILGNTYIDAGATAIDNIDGDVTVNIVTVSDVDVNIIGSHEVTYNVSDAAGNDANEAIRDVIVSDITIPPIYEMTEELIDE